MNLILISSKTLKNNFKDLYAVFVVVCFVVNQRCGGQPAFCGSAVVVRIVFCCLCHEYN